MSMDMKAPPRPDEIVGDNLAELGVTIKAAAGARVVSVSNRARWFPAVAA